MQLKFNPYDSASRTISQFLNGVTLNEQTPLLEIRVEDGTLFLSSNSLPEHKTVKSLVKQARLFEMLSQKLVGENLTDKYKISDKSDAKLEKLSVLILEIARKNIVNTDEDLFLYFQNSLSMAFTCLAQHNYDHSFQIKTQIGTEQPKTFSSVSESLSDSLSEGSEKLPKSKSTKKEPSLIPIKEESSYENNLNILNESLKYWELKHGSSRSPKKRGSLKNTSKFKAVKSEVKKYQKKSNFVDLAAAQVCFDINLREEEKNLTERIFEEPAFLEILGQDISRQMINTYLTDPDEDLIKVGLKHLFLEATGNNFNEHVKISSEDNPHLILYTINYFEFLIKNFCTHYYPKNISFLKTVIEKFDHSIGLIKEASKVMLLTPTINADQLSLPETKNNPDITSNGLGVACNSFLVNFFNSDIPVKDTMPAIHFAHFLKSMTQATINTPFKFVQKAISTSKEDLGNQTDVSRSLDYIFDKDCFQLETVQLIKYPAIPNCKIKIINLMTCRMLDPSPWTSKLTIKIDKNEALPRELPVLENSIVEPLRQCGFHVEIIKQLKLK